jgi:hypothetical protein
MARYAHGATRLIATARVHVPKPEEQRGRQTRIVQTRGMRLV